MNNVFLGKTIENVRKHRDIKLVTTEKGRNYLVSERKYHTTKLFTEHLLATEMKKNNKKNNRNSCKQTCLFRTLNTGIK